MIQTSLCFRIQESRYSYSSPHHSSPRVSTLLNSEALYTNICYSSVKNIPTHTHTQNPSLPGLGPQIGLQAYKEDGKVSFWLLPWRDGTLDKGKYPYPGGTLY